MSTTQNTPSRIKVCLFDIGGVCVASPFKAIQDYEIAHSIPENWVNFAISRSGPTGAWQRLERGEIKLNEEEFFSHFRRDLHDQHAWEQYWEVFVVRRRKNSDSTVSSSLPPPLQRTSKSPPTMDTTTLFWDMMSRARTTDPYVYPTLRYLRSQHPDLVLAALSNTVPFPPDHPFSHPQSPEQDPRSWFDVFISSSDVGLRKPARDIYELALSRIGEWAKKREKGEIRASEVVFLDDIGENCKMGRTVGMQVIKVNLGKTSDAVQELGRRVFGIEDLFERVKAWEKSGGKSRL